MTQNVRSLPDTSVNRQPALICGLSHDRGGDDARKAHHLRPDRRLRRDCRGGAQRRLPLGPV